MVRIRMKAMGRRHRPFFRICAMDSRTGRDGRPIEELGHYDPMSRNAETQTVLNAEPGPLLALGRRSAFAQGAVPAQQTRREEARAGRTVAGRGGPRSRAGRLPRRSRPHRPRRLPHRTLRDRKRTSLQCPRRCSRIDVLTLFPSLFDGFLSQSILNRAIGKGWSRSYAGTYVTGRRESTSRLTIVRLAEGRAWF